MRQWKSTSEYKAPDEKVVMTKIDDGEGERNVGPLQRIGNLWYTPDGKMYVYYTPTHWSEE